MLRQVLCANLSYFSSLASPIVAQAADDLTAVGIVDKVENEAKVVSGDTVTPAIIGTLVHLKDELRTGVDGCLKITSRDDTVLTLGEKASVIIDRYVCDPDQMSARPCTRPPRAPFASPQAASRGLKQNKIAVSTPVADIGVRGTEFWGGLLDKYGVLVFEGEISVKSGRQRDSVRVRAGHGHPLTARSARSGQGLERAEDSSRRRHRSVALGD